MGDMGVRKFMEVLGESEMADRGQVIKKPEGKT